MSYRKKLLFGVFGLIALMAGATGVLLPDSAIEDVFISNDAENFVYSITLSLPFEYVDHVPVEKTEVIQVSLRSNTWFGFENNEYLGSETIAPDILQSQMLTDIAYEGSVVGGPFLTIRFKEPVDYHLSVDESSNKIVIVVSK